MCSVATRWRNVPACAGISNRVLGFGEVRILDDAGQPVAVYRGRGLRGGELETAKGQRWLWKSFGFWRRAWGFTRNGEEPLVLFRLRLSWGHALDEVTVDADARRMPELPMLLLLGRYLTVRRRKRGHGS